MKNKTTEFNSESSLESYVDENYGLKLDIDISKDSSDFTLVETAHGFVVGYLSPDYDRQGDYFEDDDGAGKLIRFKSGYDREEKMEELSKIEKLQYLVDKYDHGNIHYSIANTASYPDRRWDVAQGCALFIPCDDVQDRYQSLVKEKGVEEARQAFIKDSNNTLDEYSKWCNGEIYGITTVSLNKDGEQISEDSGSGYIGYSEASKQMKSNVAIDVAEQEVSHVAKNVTIENFTKEDVKSLPFSIVEEGFQSAKIAKVYDDIIVSVKYEAADTAIVYVWNPSLEKPVTGQFEQWQKQYNVTPEQFLESRMNSDINDVVRKKLKQEKSVTNQPTI